jgi:hypothetical protein
MTALALRGQRCHTAGLLLLLPLRPLLLDLEVMGTAEDMARHLELNDLYVVSFSNPRSSSNSVEKGISVVELIPRTSFLMIFHGS